MRVHYIQDILHMAIVYITLQAIGYQESKLFVKF